jgi:hemoglobin
MIVIRKSNPYPCGKRQYCCFACRHRYWSKAATHTLGIGSLAMHVNQLTEDAIVRLVDAFYARVRQDPELGPVFERAIGADGWPMHLRRMYDFWSSVMLTTGRYKGNPLAVHADVPEIEEAMFERWLALFGETARDMFPEELADVFGLKAGRIAESLKLGLFFRPSADGLHIRSAAQGTGSSAGGR